MRATIAFVIIKISIILSGEKKNGEQSVADSLNTIHYSPNAKKRYLDRFFMTHA